MLSQNYLTMTATTATYNESLLHLPEETGTDSVPNLKE